MMRPLDDESDLLGRGFLVTTFHEDSIKVYTIHAFLNSSPYCLYIVRISILPVFFYIGTLRSAPPMSLRVEDEWSDSDEEVPSEVETSILLGVPDGPIDSTTDISDAAVSRMGGHPVRYISLHLYLSNVCGLTTCLPIQGISPI